MGRHGRKQQACRQEAERAHLNLQHKAESELRMQRSYELSKTTPPPRDSLPPASLYRLTPPPVSTTDCGPNQSIGDFSSLNHHSERWGFTFH